MSRLLVLVVLLLATALSGTVRHRMEPVATAVASEAP